MEYSKEPLREDNLREAMNRMHDIENAQSIIFLKMRDEKPHVGIVRDIFPERMVLLWFDPRYEDIKYEDVAEWVIPSKVELSKEVFRLASILKEHGVEEA